MTHSAAMASEILPGKTILEALNTDLVCDAINTAMRELFLQIVYGRTQSASLKMDFRLVQDWRILEKDFVLRLVQCTELLQKDLVTWKWLKVM